MVGLGPAKAIARGIVSVFQELTLVRSLTVAENLFLSAPPRRAWASIDRGKLEADARALLEDYNVGASAAAIVGDMPLGQQQMVEIVRAVRRKPRVLLLDEATAALSAAEVQWLMRIVEAERKRGSIILFISHRWEEITAFCQRVAVMRNGELVTLADVDDISHDRAVELMTGARLGGVFPTKRSPAGLRPSRSARPDERCAARRGPAARQGRNPRHRRPCRTGTGRAAQIAVRRPSAPRRRDLRRGPAGASQKPPRRDRSPHRLRAAGTEDRGAFAAEERGGQSLLRHPAADIAPGGLHRPQGRTADRRRGYQSPEDSRNRPTARPSGS